VIKNDAGEITEIRCTYDPATRGGDSPDGRKVKATMHWVSAQHAVTAEVRRFGPLFDGENPAVGADGDDLSAGLNPNSLTVIGNAKVEPALRDAAVGAQVQFERLGYFSVDPDTTSDTLVFNEIVSLKDTWKKIQKAGG